MTYSPLADTWNLTPGTYFTAIVTAGLHTGWFGSVATAQTLKAALFTPRSLGIVTLTVCNPAIPRNWPIETGVKLV